MEEKSIKEIMERSEKQEQRKKQVTEIKTFSVPFSLDEINENITVTKNSLSKPSKEQIINQAFKFHSQGNISDPSGSSNEIASCINGYATTMFVVVALPQAVLLVVWRSSFAKSGTKILRKCLPNSVLLK